MNGTSCVSMPAGLVLS
uniref:p28 n=1 Tax=Murine hepatitis virus TaxID=11138 RepID=Q86966_9BETC